MSRHDDLYHPGDPINPVNDGFWKSRRRDRCTEERDDWGDYNILIPDPSN